MKKDDQQRLMLNIIILVISGFILIFMLLGKFLSSGDPISFLFIENQENIVVVDKSNRVRENA
ncbi:MAG: hypothetical protein COB38_09645 [Gammaproteobacteria bacterium]|nr:MAG: hypothetical protein COB38_09645 [Gammaproteobacteria bacterium]